MADALGSLLAILEDSLSSGDTVMGDRTRKQLLQWYISQPLFVQNICQHSMVQAGFILDQDDGEGDMSTSA